MVLEDKEDRWFEGLEMTPPMSSGCGACIPEFQHYTQAPWTVVLRQSSQTFILQGRHIRLVGDSAKPYLF